MYNICRARSGPVWHIGTSLAAWKAYHHFLTDSNKIITLSTHSSSSRTGAYFFTSSQALYIRVLFISISLWL